MLPDDAPAKHAITLLPVSPLRAPFSHCAESINDSIIAQRSKKGVPEDGDADKYFQPFAMAMEARRAAKMKMAALDATEKMIGA